MAKEPNRDYGMDWLGAFTSGIAAQAKKDEKAETPKHPGGKGGTSIQRVEIVVTQNNNPSRVARSIVDELSKLQRNPRVSKYAPATAR